MSGHGRGYEGRERYQRKFTFTNQPQKEGQEKEKKIHTLMGQPNNPLTAKL